MREEKEIFSPFLHLMFDHELLPLTHQLETAVNMRNANRFKILFAHAETLNAHTHTHTHMNRMHVIHFDSGARSAVKLSFLRLLSFLRYFYKLHST